MFLYIMIENIRFIMIIIQDKGLWKVENILDYGIHSLVLMISIKIGHYKLKNILTKFMNYSKVEIEPKKHLQKDQY